jgi:hypothetical protein
MKNKNLNSIKKVGFKIPDNYLESFDNSILNKLNKTQSLKNNYKSGFKTPDHYFEQLDDTLINKLTTKKTVKIISLVSWRKVTYITGIAASIILMVSLFNNNKSQPTFGDLEIALIENYITEKDFTNDDLASLLSEESLTLNNFMDSNLNSSHLEEYILDHSSTEDFFNE